MTVEWWENFFDDVWLEGGFGPAGDEAPVEEIDYLWRQLKLRPGSRLADICCGVGRHSIPLARRGAEVTGVDFCQKYVELARKRAERLSVTFVRADMRETGLEAGAFDAVVNLWTSFGYFADEDDDERALAEWSRLLRPGGRLAMSLVSRDGLMAHFQREINQRLYAVHELVRMGARHGLSIVDAHGSLLGEPVGREHTHMYLTFARA
jgi:ubiquinone/menaquinone biosynthesis C-methylase UbiE